MDSNKTNHFNPLVLVTAGALALSGCAPNLFGSATPPPVTTAAETVDANGIIAYDSFRVMVARDGDTIASMAGRVGLTDVVLARYNGLPLNYLLRQGDRLALPDDAQAQAVTDGWTPDVVTGVLDDLPDDVASGNAPDAAPGVQLTRHRVERGETAFTIARLYGVSVTALASWNGLAGDLELTLGRSLIIPPREQQTIPSPTPEATPVPVAVTPTPQASGISEPGTNTMVALPPSADEPLPEDLNPEPETLDGPKLAVQDNVGVPGKFLTPVSGKVVRGYSIAPGREKNEGLDFETAPGAAVKAAEAGEVALVSRSLGGLGTIVLVRHRDDIMTVYGRVDGVQVKKGQKISRGQAIGTVAEADRPIFHFEIRRGTQSIDPTPFL